MLSKDFWDRYKWGIVTALFLFTSLFLFVLFKDIFTINKQRKVLMSGLIEINAGFEDIPSRYVPSMEYFSAFVTATVPANYDSFESAATGVGFTDELAHFNEVWNVTESNQALYDLADKYYQVYWGSERVSPLFPLALANVETGGRADRNVTWSALYPSKILPISDLYTADITKVVSDDSYYKPLSSEWSTRDRGALQMSPSYGTGNAYFNKQMSGNEKDKLKDVDTSKYSSWVEGASDKPGDRFYTPDVCLRLASANTDAIKQMVKNDYKPESDLQLVCMLAQYHHRSGVWSNTKHSYKCGEWKSSEGALEFASKISSQGFVDELVRVAKSDRNKYTISRDEAYKLYTDYFGKNFNEYTESKLVGCYPITVLYAYIKMGILYSSV